MTKKPVLMITHVHSADPGQAAVILSELGYPVETLRANKGQPLPERVAEYAGFVSFGGPQSANDDHIDYIKAELDWVPHVAAQNVPFLGVCLGAQIVARSLGARVAPHPEGLYEFGYYPIEPAAQDGALQLAHEIEVCHRHGEAFELPAGAVRLATRETFPNQAFRYGRSTFGIQFHPEVNDAVLHRWLDRDPPPEDLAFRGAQPAAEQYAKHARHQAAMHSWLRRFLAFWVTTGEVTDRAG